MTNRQQKRFAAALRYVNCPGSEQLAQGEAAAAEEIIAGEISCAAVKQCAHRWQKLAINRPLTVLSLDLKERGHILGLRMSRLRAIVVAVLALAVAALPVAGVGVSAAHADCAKSSAASPAGHDRAGGHHATMDHTKTDHEMTDHAEGHDGMAPCGGPSTCGGKCLCIGLAAVMPGFWATNAPRLPRAAASRVVVHLSGPAYVPPSPPPRV